MESSDPLEPTARMARERLGPMEAGGSPLVPAPPRIRRDEEVPAITGEWAAPPKTPFVPEFAAIEPAAKPRRAKRDRLIEESRPVATKASGGTVVTFPPKSAPGWQDATTVGGRTLDPDPAPPPETTDPGRPVGWPPAAERPPGPLDRPPEAGSSWFEPLDQVTADLGFDLAKPGRWLGAAESGPVIDPVTEGQVGAAIDPVDDVVIGQVDEEWGLVFATENTDSSLGGPAVGADRFNPGGDLDALLAELAAVAEREDDASKRPPGAAGSPSAGGRSPRQEPRDRPEVFASETSPLPTAALTRRGDVMVHRAHSIDNARPSTRFVDRLVLHLGFDDETVGDAGPLARRLGLALVFVVVAVVVVIAAL